MKCVASVCKPVFHQICPLSSWEEALPSPCTRAVLSTSCSSETSSSSGRWGSEPNPPNPIYCGKSEDRTPTRNIWSWRWPPPVLDVSSFRKCWDTAKPQKLVKVLGKDRGIQAYVGSGDGITSVMRNKRAWKCITLKIGKIRGLAREDGGLDIVEDMDKLRTRSVPPHIRNLPTLPPEPHTDGNSLCDCFRMWLPCLTWFPVRMQISRAGRYRGTGIREMLLGIQRYIILGHGTDVKLSSCLVLLLIRVIGLLDRLWNLMSRVSFRYKILILIIKYFYLFFKFYCSSAFLIANVRYSLLQKLADMFVESAFFLHSCEFSMSYNQIEYQFSVQFLSVSYCRKWTKVTWSIIFFYK